MHLPYKEVLDHITHWKNMDYFEFEGHWRDWDILIIADGDRQHLRYYMDGTGKNNYTCDFIFTYDQFKRMTYADYSLAVAKQAFYRSVPRSEVNDNE